MDALSEEDFEARMADFDRAVDRSEDIDRFCSSTDWVWPAHRELMPARHFVGATDGELWIVGAIRELDDGLRVFEPLEASWALASPFVGIDRADKARRVADWLLARRHDWDVLLVAGLFERSRVLGWLAGALQSRLHLRVGEPTPRYVVDLEGGVEAYLARRSSNFRRSLRKAERRARAAGITFEAAHAHSPADADAVFERILGVERRSWKGREGVGIDDGRMSSFYRAMGRRIAAQGRHRCWFARTGDGDVGYVLGGLRGTHYRGLQFSYVDELGELSLGNLMQVWQMRALVAEGVATYDLGSEAVYKQRWADRVLASPVIFAFPRR